MNVRLVLRSLIVVLACAPAAHAQNEPLAPGPFPPLPAASQPVTPAPVQPLPVVVQERTASAEEALSAAAPPPGTDVGLPYSSTSIPNLATTGEPAPFFGWDDGFYLRSADKNFSLRITGQLQADYRWYVEDSDHTDIDEFLLRRARFGLEATLFKYYEFRFLPDFGQGQTRIQDAYMNVHYWDEFQVIAGKFKQPFSYEQLIQDRFTPLMERSLIDQLVPARDLGVMFHGQNLIGGRVDYGIAVSNGEQNGDSDTNNSKDFNARIAVRPFAAWDDSFLKRFQVGMSGGYGLEHEPVNPTGLKSPAGVPFFQFDSGVISNGSRWRLSPEVAYFLGGFGMSAQYFHMEQKFQSSASAPTERIPFDGFYVQATYLLTGEERTGYSQQIAPLHPFDPMSGLCNIGAWELVARASRLKASDNVFAAGDARLADPAVSSNGATEMTVGYNWYLNKWARVQVNWEHLWFDRKVKLGPGLAGLLWNSDAVMTRLQFVF
jgi:phosphate-selective porin OprO and OprP